MSLDAQKALDDISEKIGVSITKNKETDKYECGTLSMDSKHSKMEYGVPAAISTFFYPLFLLVPSIIITCFNPCIVYAQLMVIMLLCLFGASFIFAFAHILKYNSIMYFCSKLSIKLHICQTIGFWGSMSATLCFMNLYAYDPNFTYLIFITISFVTTIILYFVCLFQKHHYHVCNLAGTVHTESKRELIWGMVTADKVFTALSILFTFFWVATLLVTNSLSHELWGDNRNDAILEGCVNVTTT